MIQDKNTNKVNEVLIRFSFIDEIKSDQQLKADLGLDSLSMVELILALEEAFGIESQMEDLDPSKLNIVANVYVLIDKYAV